MCFKKSMEAQNINFTGMLYGNMGTHRTRGIVCCAHGDRKFIKFINKLAAEQPDSFTINGKNGDIPKLIIETEKIPQISPLERFVIKMDKLQKKAFKLRKENKITSFTYEFRKDEYRNLRMRYPFISAKTLDTFEDNIKHYCAAELREFFNKFFS